MEPYDNVLIPAIMFAALFADSRPVYSYPMYNQYGGMEKNTAGMLNEALSQMSCQSMIDSKMAELYADNISKLQVQCTSSATAAFPSQAQISEEPKLSLIERLDRIIFPEDPIRDWVDRRIKEIDAKYDKLISQLDGI